MSDVKDAVKLDLSQSSRFVGISSDRLAQMVVEAEADARLARASAVELERQICKLARHSDSDADRIVNLQDQLATYRDKALWKLILTAYGNAPFGTDHAKVVVDAKAMLRTMEGGA